MNSRTIYITVSGELSGSRLDGCLAKLIKDSSRSYLQKLIKNGKVICDGEVVTSPRFTVKSGNKIAVEVSVAEESDTPVAEDNFDYEILFEDPHMLVINKPPFTVVHPAAGNHTGTVVNALLGRYPEMLDEFEDSGGRPGIVHRLDKDTSGCLVIAKTPQAQFALSKSFADRQVSKTYLALAVGSPKKSQARVETLIGRHPVNRQKMAVVERNGKEAITIYKVVRSGLYDNIPITLMEVDILTGRTHQIRVHLSHSGLPILGDQLYGGSKRVQVERQMLHAWRIKIPHPVTNELMEFKSPLPYDMESVILTMCPDLTTLDNII